MAIARLIDLDLSGSYTYSDYALWQFQERVELIMGKVFPMSAPGTRHQEALMNIYTALRHHLHNSPCRTFIAPYDVILPGINGKEDTVVQPDLIVVCDPNKIQERGCTGAPDLVVEVLSPSTFRRDLYEKRNLYEHHGVREYWTVDPSRTIILIHTLNSNGKFNSPELASTHYGLQCRIFPEFHLDLKATFDSMLREPVAVYGEYNEDGLSEDGLGED